MTTKPKEKPVQPAFPNNGIPIRIWVPDAYGRHSYDRSSEKGKAAIAERHGE
ncbi:hypothetical protein KAR91_16615 [Candidatus Pacearchaeota archaeon]|nr:hypothetical protein [Candidatus Pacearchaeota archaeon]